MVSFLSGNVVGNVEHVKKETHRQHACTVHESHRFKQYRACADLTILLRKKCADYSLRQHSNYNWKKRPLSIAFMNSLLILCSRRGKRKPASHRRKNILFFF